jgi:hypothetical protein
MPQLNIAAKSKKRVDVDTKDTQILQANIHLRDAYILPPVKIEPGKCLRNVGKGRAGQLISNIL